MADSRPAQKIIDTLLWDRLGSFWTDRYDQSDRLALSSVYEAAAKVLEGEQIRAIEIDDAKSIQTCPVFSQRRWVRLDLNRYAEMRAWLRFLASQGLAAVDVIAGADKLLCEDSAPHPRHWHIRFPWDSRVQGSTIELGYPLSPELVEGWRSTGLAGTFGVDYSIAVGGTALQILRDDVYDFNVGMNFSAAAYKSVKWTQIRASGISGADSVPVPAGFGQGGPIHALIIHNPPPGTTSSFFSSNEPGFKTTQKFIPSAALLPGNNLQVPGVASGDVVLLFGLVAGSETQVHTHRSVSEVLSGNIPITSWTPSVAVGSAVLYGTPGIYGHELHLFRDGFLVSPSTYTYDQPTNTIFFKTAQSNSGGTLNYDVHWTEDATGGQSHRHFACASGVLTTRTTFDPFDDGGTFDDGGFFDTTTFATTATFPFAADLTTAWIYANGILLESGVQYTAALAGSTTIVSFATNIAAAYVELRYRRDSFAFGYGGTDLPSALPAAAVANLASDLSNISAAFYARFNTTLRNISALVEAANVLAAGGNPLLTLFADEWADYNGLPVDVANAAVDSATARAVESAQTKLVAMPFMQDHVLSPTVRLQSGVDFDVVDGAVYALTDLVASRGPTDATPGVWWVPVAYFDERMLAKNFGALVGDEQDSSEAYRGLLEANLTLRYGGPTPQNVHSAVAAYAGSAIATADAAVTGVRSVVTDKVLTITSSAGLQQIVSVPTTTALAVGMPVAAGQSLANPLAFAGILTGVLGFDGSELQLSPPAPAFVPGALVRLALADGYGTFKVLAISLEQQALRTIQHVQFTAATTQALSAAPLAAVYLEGPGPYASFDGTITGVTDVTKQYLTTSQGEYPLTEPSRYQLGDHVSRGQAIEPKLVTLLADDVTPDWYRQRPAAAVAVSTVRTAVITAGPSYGAAVFTPAFPELLRGTTVVVGAMSYQVVGSHNGIASVLPSVASAGPAIITAPVSQVSAQYEFAAADVSAAIVGPVNTNAASVTVVSAAGFPASGRVAIVDSLQRRITFSYAFADGNVLRGIQWEEPGTVATGTAHVLSELKPERLHPAFAALVAQRVGVAVPLSVGDATTTLLYNLLKTNAVVVETKTPAHPQALRLLLEDTLPANISTTLYSTHVVQDTLELKGVDAGSAPPSFTISIATPDTPGPQTGALSFVASPVYAATANAAAVLASWNASSFGWSARVTGGPSTTLAIATPLASSTQIFGFRPASTYIVSVKAVTPAGTVRTASFTVVC